MQIYFSGLCKEGSADVSQRRRRDTHLDGKERSNDVVRRDTSLPITVSRT